MAEEPWGPDYVIDGKYRLVSKLGQGGMGAVWRADHLTLNAPVAVKLLDPSIANSEEGLARFLREAQSAAALRGAHVVQTFDYGVHQSVPYIVMEMLVGESLADRLATKGPLTAAAVASLLKQVARAMSKAHQAGIVHRDLKPDNIFLVEVEDEEPVAKVLDFGIAKATGELGLSTASKTRTGALLGTPYYMSPEQAQGTAEVDFRSDLWSLAVITFEALLGKRPFDSEALGDLLLKICALPLPVPSKLGAVPAGFDVWFAKAANRDPAQRFGTASEMSKAFEKLVTPGRPTNVSFDSISLVGPPPGITPAGDSLEGSEVLPTTPPARRRPRLLVAGAVIALAAAIAIFVASRGSKHAPEGADDAARKTAALVPEAHPTAATAAPVVAPVDSVVAAPSAVASAEPEDLATAAAAGPRPAGAKHAVALKPIAAKPVHAAPSAPAGKKTDSFDPLQMRR